MATIATCTGAMTATTITYEEQGAMGRETASDNGLETSHLEPEYVFFTYLLTFTNNDFD